MIRENDDDDVNAGEDSRGISRPTSAFQYYMKDNSISIKEALLKEGKDGSLGSVVSIASAKWRSFGPEDKVPYEEYARKDRKRYDEECMLKDEEALKRQEERRKVNMAVSTDTRLRTTTLANSDVSTFKVESKRKREVSDSERLKRETKKQAKLDEEKTIKNQLNELEGDRAKQAEARLKYLLSQSDIFAHFGATKSLEQYNSSSNDATDTLEDMDEDEKAMAQEVESENIEEQSTLLLKQPSIISGGDMRQYQLEGLNWMIRLQQNGINGILADEMGLGKTLQSISVIAYLREYKNINGPHLVMVPKSTLSNWCNEFQRWCPSIRILRFHGNKDERHDIIVNMLKPSASNEDRSWDVVVTTYEVVNLEKAPLTKIAWRYLIIDEAHRLKNEASQFSQTVRLLNTQSRLLLTGTPLQNNLHELWALLNFLLPDVFASSEQFDEWFNLDIGDIEVKQRMIGQLHKLLRPFMLRRLKADVEKSLPPKTETILFTGMSVMQKNLYRQILMRDIDTINTAGSSNSQQTRTAILNIVMQLRKCCNHPYLFPGQEDRSLNPMGDHLYLNCGKMVLLEKLLTIMKARGHRVLIFSQMTRMLDILEDYLLSKQYNYCRIDGNTTYEEREDRIYDFNKAGSDKFVFILSTRAGGLGINLQTADTVILYDSDWNPQADLQAQDRAHRIGQKKPVHVFRLVTDESVEVKVVERAQQKLKLDAVVVQQGRLQEKEKKLSKQDLLDTLRFGADKIFRSKDSTITAADIEMILEEGRKRTAEMNEKLQLAEKGDLYDFRLDGGMAVQTFEGKDYSDKSARAEMNAFNNILFLDPGKRERKTIVNYSETNQRQNVAEEGEKRVKLPRHLRLNKMEDWQFFNRTRLMELQAEEIKLFDELVDKGELPPAGNMGKLQLLSDDFHFEKTKLLNEGFGNWTRVHFNNFVRACAKYGRYEHEKIAKDVNRPVEETKRYAEVFWAKGSSEFPLQEWERVSKLIEKGEKRLEEISRLTIATAKLIGMFDDPWEELSFRNVGNVNRIFTAVEDRFLLCLTHLHGYGSWEQVRNSIRRCERFRFDFFLQSCSAEALGKRCELLMRSAERELLEIEKKRLPSEIGSLTVVSSKNTQDSMKRRMVDITKSIADESKKLSLIRAQIQKLKSTSSGDLEKDGEQKTQEKKSSGRNQNVSVPESLYPVLCRLLVEGGPDGISKIIERFIDVHPSYSKRQVEIKINEIGIKEKQANDTYKVWHVKKDFEKYLNSAESEAKSREKVNVQGSKVALKRKSEEVPENDDMQDGISAKEPKKYKRAFGFFVKAMRQEAEAKLGPDAPKTDALRDVLTKMWEEADSSTRKVYELKEQEDHERYKRELELWQKTTSVTINKKAKKQ